MKSFYAQTGQSIQDIAFMAYGDSTAIGKLLTENPDLKLTLSTYAGVKINYTPQSSQNFANNKLRGMVVATKGIPDSDRFKKYLLQENGFGFTLEDGSGKIELEP